ncbi:hypothetical protein BGX38DRAFT_1218494 [Terfezia claveryi]|nr:hypothetical protein BGX38DRAFT_1218494 [Terfezia claveryi]
MVCHWSVKRSLGLFMLLGGELLVSFKDFLISGLLVPTTKDVVNEDEGFEAGQTTFGGSYVSPSHETFQMMSKRPPAEPP